MLYHILSKEKLVVKGQFQSFLGCTTYDGDGPYLLNILIAVSYCKF